jgi:predicted amidophosphoribosyltransferase
MPETICRRCGSDLQVGNMKCSLCELELTMVCPDCGYTSDSKVHVDCQTAVSLLC